MLTVGHIRGTQSQVDNVLIGEISVFFLLLSYTRSASQGQHKAQRQPTPVHLYSSVGL